jgi:hypothetical protein
MATKQAAKKPARTTRSRRAEVVEEGPRYLLLQDSYLDGVYRKAGTEVIYYGEPGRALQALNAEAKARKQAIRDINRNPDLDAEGKVAAKKELSDLWNGVESDADLDDEDEDDEGEAPAANTTIGQRSARAGGGLRRAPLPDDQRAELEKHALASIEATEAAQRDDTNRVTVKLQGHNEPDPTELQGATPVLDKQGKGPEADKK